MSAARRRRRWRSLASPLVALVAGLRGEVRGRRRQPRADRLDLALDWFPNPDHVAIYEAMTRGTSATWGWT